ncbi:hypothetical protein [Nostoc sp.]
MVALFTPWRTSHFTFLLSTVLVTGNDHQEFGCCANPNQQHQP